MRSRGAVAAVLTTLLGVPAAAGAAAPPEGAAISDNLEYVTRMADAAGTPKASSTASRATTSWS